MDWWFRKNTCIKVLVSKDLKNSKHKKTVLDSVGKKLGIDHEEGGEYKEDDMTFIEYTFNDNKTNRGLIVILSRAERAKSHEYLDKHIDHIRKVIGFENAIAVFAPDENEVLDFGGAMCWVSSTKMGSFLFDLLPVKKEDRQQDSKGGGKETMEKWPLLDNCNVKVYLTGLNETTLREVKKELSTFVAGRCLHQIHVSKRSETDEKLSVLDDNSVVICCVHDRGRIIIISDTEPDEAGDIVKKAEEACGKQRVMVLLCGHNDLSDENQSLYDKNKFNDNFLKNQPHLEKKVKKCNFLSMNWTLSRYQKDHVSKWIQEVKSTPSPEEGENEWPGETAMATDGGMMEQVPAKTTSSKDEGEYIVDNKDMMQF
ncbi:PREDICTED: uncharacterized protein LOC109479585 isoform X2 [Branchiostoma belcheri]|nr:PREDICTED: uncharacterized protein LOC109479585 isoform X2 [Branchiostoma belcheri]